MRQCQCAKADREFPPVYDKEDYEYEGYRMWRVPAFFPAESVQEAYDRWQSVCSNFTVRSLSFDQDRLVALSGLVKQFSKLMKSNFGREEKYLAGIWAALLPRELLWQVELNQFSVLGGRRHKRYST